MTDSVGSEILELLAGNRHLDRDIRFGLPEREKAMDDFAVQAGLSLPEDARWVLVNQPGLSVRPRMMPWLGTDFMAYFPGARLNGSIGLQREHERVTSFHIEYVDGEAAVDFVKQLVPIMHAGATYYCLDFSYDAECPPLVDIDIERGWGRRTSNFIAPSLIEFLRFELAPEDLIPNIANPPPTKKALAWTEWFEQTVLEQAQ